MKKETVTRYIPDRATRRFAAKQQMKKQGYRHVNKVFKEKWKSFDPWWLHQNNMEVI